MVLATITLLAAALVITSGTSAPILTRFMKSPGQVGPEFYNRVNLPIALLIAFLLGLVPFLTWRGETVSEVLKKVRLSAGIALLVTVGAGIAAVREPLYLFFVFLATLALASNLEKTVRKWRAHSLQGAGGYLAHVGVGVASLSTIGCMRSRAETQRAQKCWNSDRASRGRRCRRNGQSG